MDNKTDCVSFKMISREEFGAAFRGQLIERYGSDECCSSSWAWLMAYDYLKQHERVVVVPSEEWFLKNWNECDHELYACSLDQKWIAFRDHVLKNTNTIAQETLDKVFECLEHYKKGAPFIGFDRGELAGETLKLLKDSAQGETE